MESWAWIILIALALLLAVTAVITLVPASIIKRRMVDELARNARGRLALTYDDGPGQLLHPPLLKMLAEHGVRATFFLVGFRAQRAPDAADAVVAAGHEIGNHTYWHRHAWRILPWQAVADVRQGYESMSRWMSSQAMFRPPFGKLTTWTHLLVRKRRAAMCFWTFDGGDTWPTLPDPAVIAQQLADRGGGVVLLHSHDRGQERQQYVLAVTECLLNAARERGLRVCTMSEILNDPDAAPTTPSASDAKGAIGGA